MEPECAELSEAKPKFPAFALLGLLRVPKSHAPPRNRYIASAITGTFLALLASKKSALDLVVPPAPPALLALPW